MTWEEIQAEIQSKPETATAILDNINNITGGTDFLANSNKAHFDANVGTYTSNIYNKLDEDVFAITGLRKEANEKSYDFQKRVLADFKKKADSSVEGTPEEIKVFQDKIKDLEEKVKNGESSSHWKSSYEEVVTELKTNKESHQAELDKLSTQILSNSVGSDIDSALGGLNINTDLPEGVRQSYINQHKMEMTKNAKVVDGKVVYYTAEGTPLMDKQYKNATAEYLLKERLKDILKVDATPGGGAPEGGKGEVITVGTGDSATMKLALDRNSFKTRGEYLEVAEKALLDKGITRGQKEFNEMLDAGHVEYEVSKLPRN